MQCNCSQSTDRRTPPGPCDLPSVSVAGRLVAGIYLGREVLGERRLLLDVRQIAGIGCISGGGVSGGGVSGGIVGGGGIGWRIRGGNIRHRLRVGRDGNIIYTMAETTQGEVC